LSEPQSRKLQSKTLTDARNAMSEIIEDKASEQSYYEEFMENIFLDNLQQELRDKVNKIYPFRELEVRKTELLK